MGVKGPGGDTMNIQIIHRIQTIIVLLISLMLLTACSGGKIIILDEIQGQGALDENSATDYTVRTIEGAVMGYAWTVDPPSAGYFSNADNVTSTIHAYEVTSDTDVLICVTATGKVKTPPCIVTRDVTIEDTNEMPHAAASLDKPKIGHGQSVQFTNASTDPQGEPDIVLYEWDFSYDDSDGFCCECVDCDPRHTFDEPGIYPVQLRVTDISNISDMLTLPLVVEVVENYAPTVTDVTHTRTTSQAGNENEAVQLEVEFVDMFPPDDTHTFLWSCDYGFFDDRRIQAPLWYPPDEPVDCDINVVVTDWYGLTDAGLCHQWVTDFPVIANPSAAGNVIPSQDLQTALDGTINPSDWMFPNHLGDGNVVFMSYWATWSANSMAGIPLLLDVYELYKNDDYYQLMINESDPPSEVTNYVILNGYQVTYWPLDTDASYFTRTRGWNAGVSEIPQHVVFDRDGRCRWAEVGQLTWTIELQLAIEEML